MSESLPANELSEAERSEIVAGLAEREPVELALMQHELTVIFNQKRAELQKVARELSLIHDALDLQNYTEGTPYGSYQRPN